MSTDPWIKNIPSYTILTADTTWYVRTTGSDTTGDGSSGNPWATVQHATDYIAMNINFATFTAIIDIGAGTFSTYTTTTVGGGEILYQGAGKASTSFSLIANEPCGALIRFNNLKVVEIVSNAPNIFTINTNCSIGVSAFGASVVITNNSILNFFNDIYGSTIDIDESGGTKECVFYVGANSYIYSLVIFNLTAGANYTKGFFFIEDSSVVDHLGSTPTGSACTGPHAYVNNSILNIGGKTVAYAFGSLGDVDSVCINGGRVVNTITVNYTFPTAVTALLDEATVNLDASLGGIFTLTAGGNRTIAPPTNPVPGQPIIIKHKASAADRTLALDTGTGGFRFGSDITALTATVDGKTDYIGCRYDSADNKWDVVSYVKGF